MTSEPDKTLIQQFAYRFGEPPAFHEATAGDDTLAYLAGRRCHRRYLDRPVDTALIETLAAALSEERDTIEEVIEPYLIQQGFLLRTPRGRALAAAAYSHLGLDEPDGVQQLELIADTGQGTGERDE